jgi:ubiquinone/menaquinone biosynthesis C-methylase UbiE/uncharacterized protein YbaR (Trm112 family)
MRSRLLEHLRCPVSGGTGLRLYGVDVRCETGAVTSGESQALPHEANVKTGVIVDPDAGTAHPIIDFIAVMLPDEDVELEAHHHILDSLLAVVPDDSRACIEETKRRQRKRSLTPHGEWDLAESRYYDRDVDSAAKRAAMVDVLRATPHWRTFTVRDQLLRPLMQSSESQPILEIGCGTARTISWLYPSDTNQYRYIGLDVSLNRLRVAREMLPGGDFVQASATRLPIADQSVRGVLSFGVIHHLPDQEGALRECCRVLEGEGLLALHEPTVKPPLLSPTSRIRRRLATYEHSERDLEVHPHHLLTTLREQELDICQVQYLTSPPRTLVEAVVGRFFPQAFAWKWLATVIEIFDEAYLRTVGRVSPRLGPHAIAVLAQKRSALGNGPRSPNVLEVS